MTLLDLPDEILECLDPLPVKLLPLGPAGTSALASRRVRTLGDLLTVLRRDGEARRARPGSVRDVSGAPRGTKGARQIDEALQAFARPLTDVTPRELTNPFALPAPHLASLEMVSVRVLDLPGRGRHHLERLGAPDLRSLMRLCSRVEWCSQLSSTYVDVPEDIRDRLADFAEGVRDASADDLARLRDPVLVLRRHLGAFERVPAGALGLSPVLLEQVPGGPEGAAASFLRWLAQDELFRVERGAPRDEIVALRDALVEDLASGRLAPALERWNAALDRRAGWPAPAWKAPTGADLADTLVRWAGELSKAPEPLVDVSGSDRVHLLELLPELARRVAESWGRDDDYALLVHNRGLDGAEARSAEAVGRSFALPTSFVEQRVEELEHRIHAALRGHTADPRWFVPAAVPEEASLLRELLHRKSLHPPSAVEAGLEARYGRLGIRARAALPLLMRLLDLTLLDVDDLGLGPWPRLWSAEPHWAVASSAHALRNRLAEDGAVDLATFRAASRNPCSERVLEELLELMPNVERSAPGIYRLVESSPRGSRPLGRVGGA